MTFEIDGIGNPDEILAGGIFKIDLASEKVRKYKALAGHLSCDLNGEAVILNMKNGKYYGVNSVGASIWANLQVPLSFDELQSAILDEYDVDAETCRRSVSSFLEKMAKEDLIEFVDE